MSSMVEITDTEMFIPENEELAKRLQDGLKQHFAKATVEWVDCPDLTQEPFNLAASGLCGNPVLLEMGGMSQLFPRPKTLMNYHFKDILKQIYIEYNNGLIIGAGVGLRSSQSTELSELFTNVSFSSSEENEDFMEFKNKSHLAFLNREGKCTLESINIDKLSNVGCYPYGNLFISEGKPGKVLKVHAKNCTGRHFLTAMQCALSQYSSDNIPKLVGLGGTFIMKSGRARHHVMPYNWNSIKSAQDIHNWLHYFDLDAPLVAVGTLISDSSYYEKACENIDEQKYGLTQIHFHAISSKGTGGHFYTEREPTNAVEYLGYFHPGEMFHHMDVQKKYDGLQDFTELMSYWS